MKHPSGTASCKVLVIDDEEGFRQLIVRFLSKQGWDVASAPDGKAGVALARISHDRIEQRSGESVRRLDITQPNDNATRRFFCDRL
jgi:CheY-like chemotaxis protein